MLIEIKSNAQECIYHWLMLHRDFFPDALKQDNSRSNYFYL